MHSIHLTCISKKLQIMRKSVSTAKALVTDLASKTSEGTTNERNLSPGTIKQRKIPGEKSRIDFCKLSISWRV